jgi:hypothetical protein
MLASLHAEGAVVVWRCDIVVAAMAGALAAALTGCATHADVLEQDRRIAALIERQNRSLDEVRGEIEKVRARLESRGRGTAAAAVRPRRPAPRVTGAAPHPSQTPPAQGAPPPPSGEIGMTPAPDAMSTE